MFYSPTPGNQTTEKLKLSSSSRKHFQGTCKAPVRILPVCPAAAAEAAAHEIISQAAAEVQRTQAAAKAELERVQVIAEQRVGDHTAQVSAAAEAERQRARTKLI